MKRRTAACCIALMLFTSVCSQMPLTVFAESESVNPDTDLPYAFDLRERGLISAVKYQGSYGTCWAHGTMGSLESLMLADDPTADLSEWHLALFNHMGESGSSGETDPERVLNFGGSDAAVAAMLLNRVGPMREADYPYDGEIPDTTTPIGQMQKEACLEVTAAHEYKAWENNVFQPEPLAVKKLLYSGVAPTITVSSCLLATSCFNDEYASMNYPQELAEQLYAEVPPSTSTDPHVMTLVGWDDNFPKEHFTYPPDRDGAWLVKNSWGTDWGDAGYFWLSYADQTAGAFAWYDVRPASDHDAFFSYDNHGDSGALSLRTDGEDTQAYYANVFVPESDCCLTDLMLCCTDPDDTLTVTVYTALKDPDDPVSGTPAPAAVYQGLQKGYQEVPLDTHISVRAGEPFAVTVRASGKAGQHIPCELSMETYDKVKNKSGFYFGAFNENGLAWNQIKKYFGRHQSFVSADGKTWTDTADVTKITNIGEYYLALGNVSVRAYGVHAGRVMFSEEQTELPLGETIALSSAEGADIYYAVGCGEYQLYTEPLTFSGDMTVSAYADTGSKTVYTKQYTQRKAALSSLLISDKNGLEYADLRQHKIPVKMLTGSFLQPISTGSITVNGEPLISGHKYELKPEDEATGIVIRVEQEGMLPAEYKLSVKDAEHLPIPNGLYFDPYANVACEFRNGTGLEKNLADGTETAFTYQQTAAGIWEFCFADRTESYRADIWMNDDEGYLRCFFSLEGEMETYRIFNYLNPLSFDAYPAYTNAEVIKSALAAYRNETGNQSITAKTDETMFGEITLDFYDGDKLLETMYANHFGLMYTENMKQIYYALPQYRLCDLNGDKSLSIADAVMLLRILAEDAPEHMPDKTALDAADLNNDGLLTVKDSSLLINMISRMTDGQA